MAVHLLIFSNGEKTHIWPLVLIAIDSVRVDLSQNEDSCEPAQMRRLAWAFVACMYKTTMKITPRRIHHRWRLNEPQIGAYAIGTKF